MTKVLSTYLSYTLGGWGWIDGLDFQLFHEQLGHNGTDGRTHGYLLYVLIILTFEEEIGIFKAEL